MDVDDDEARPPTPPPEPVRAPKSMSISPQKQRAKVNRSAGTSGGSWGIWGVGASAKKPSARTKSGDDSTSVATGPKPGLVRTKSVRTTSTRDKDVISRSSGSDKMSKAPSRTKSGRTSSGFGLFGVAPPPSRSKSHRTSATPKVLSRRPSIDHDAAMMSPPQTDTDVRASSKAAKLMGMKSTSRRASTRDKGKSRGKIPIRPHRRAIGWRRNKQNRGAELTSARSSPRPVSHR
jgi:hypothetical protein